MKKLKRKLIIIATLIFLASSGQLIFPSPCPFLVSFSQDAFSTQRAITPIYSSLEEIAVNPNQPVLLVFFSLACHVCWEELFEMKEFIEKLSLPVVLIGVSADEKEDIKEFIFRYSFTYPIIHDKDKKLFRQYKVKLEPFRVILYNHQPVYFDDYLLDYQTRRDKAKKCLLDLVSKLTSF